MLQVIGSLSRIGLSIMTWAPPNRSGHFSDSRALTRAVQRPANAFEAFGRCWEDLFDSIVNGVIGILLDPTQVQAASTTPIKIFRISGLQCLSGPCYDSPAGGLKSECACPCKGCGCLVFLLS